MHYKHCNDLCNTLQWANIVTNIVTIIVMLLCDAADAAAPPRCRRPRSGLFVCAHAQVAFRAAFACFLDSDARVWCVGRVLWMARAVGSVVGVFACVSVDRFWVDGDFMLCRMHASGVVLLAEYQFHTTKPLRTLVWTLHICTSVPARPRPPTNMCQNAPAPVPTPTRAHDSPRTLPVYTLCTSFIQAPVHSRTRSPERFGRIPGSLDMSVASAAR